MDTASASEYPPCRHVFYWYCFATTALDYNAVQLLRLSVVSYGWRVLYGSIVACEMNVGEYVTVPGRLH